MVARGKHKIDESHGDMPPAMSCQMAGCDAPGHYKAPRSRGNLREYNWYCLDHVREFNRKWDYFDGMNQAQIEWVMKDAVTGHRPTWPREQSHIFQDEALQARLAEFLGRTPDISRPYRARDTKEQKALALLDLTPPVSPEEIKSRYRQLVKKHHPDLHKGNKNQEELFKALTDAYRRLMSLHTS